jgi:hydrogenase maturation protease
MSAGGGLVIVGVGNVLLRDDGVGVAVVEALRLRLEREPVMLPPGTRLVDGGTLGADLARVAEGAAALILVDGVELGEEPGTVRVLEGAELTAPGAAGAGSDGSNWAPDGIIGLLAVGRLLGSLPERVVLVGIQVGEIDFGLGRSTAVTAAIPAALQRTIATAWALHGVAAGDDVHPPDTRRMAEAMA